MALNDSLIHIYYTAIPIGGLEVWDALLVFVFQTIFLFKRELFEFWLENNVWGKKKREEETMIQTHF